MAVTSYLIDILAQVESSELNVTPVLHEALRISGIALAGIFLVMGIFGAMTIVLTRLFPAEEE